MNKPDFKSKVRLVWSLAFPFLRYLENKWKAGILNVFKQYGFICIYILPAFFNFYTFDLILNGKLVREQLI